VGRGVVPVRREGEALRLRGRRDRPDAAEGREHGRQQDRGYLDGVDRIGGDELVGDGEPGSPATLEPGPTPPAQGDAADAARDKAREAAKAKLPADGTAPDGRAAKDVWVEYAVVKGMDRGEAEKADKAELIAALKP
jgi:hypothetical protein